MENAETLKMPRSLYLVWKGSDEGYFEQYYSIEDAVHDHPNETIFKADLFSIGEYQLVTKVVKNKKRKK